MSESGALIAHARPLLEAHRVPFDDGTLAGLANYTALLSRHGRSVNLVGTTDPRRIFDELVLDALQLVPEVRESGALLDVGSGAGLPGIPFALARPGWQVDLLEPRARRAAFLRTACRELGLDRVAVHEGRLEDIERGVVCEGGAWDLLTARAVFAPAAWVEAADRATGGTARVAVFASGDEAASRALLGQRTAGRTERVRTYELPGVGARTILFLRAFSESPAPT